MPQQKSEAQNTLYDVDPNVDEIDSMDNAIFLSPRKAKVVKRSFPSYRQWLDSYHGFLDMEDFLFNGYEYFQEYLKISGRSFENTQLEKR